MWLLLVPMGRGGVSGKALAVGAAQRVGGADGVLEPKAGEITLLDGCCVMRHSKNRRARSAMGQFRSSDPADNRALLWLVFLSKLTRARSRRARHSCATKPHHGLRSTP